MKAVVHINESSPEKISEAMGNVKNLKQDSRIELEDAKILMNSHAVEYARKDSDAAEYLEDYLEDGTDVLVCRNSIENLQIDEEELMEDVEIVESGIGSLNLLQERDYNYIKI